jgi:glycosyltransferase involved in cell wall biosynthesis
VTVFAAPGSDPDLGVEYLPLHELSLSDAARADVSMCPEWWLAEHHAYLQLMLEVAADPTRFDVIHNNSLHYLPIAMAAAVSTPIVSTLHTPPTPWLESAIRMRSPSRVVFTAVSAHTAAAWRHVVDDVVVIRNGIDLDRWQVGPGGGPLVWAGRIVPEKGTHLAVQAARRAGWPLLVAGPICDRRYFDREVAPHLGASIRYIGHLPQQQLRHRVAHASAMLVTPCWEEPYGLVIAEALACGTPVAGFAIGALPELIDKHTGRLVRAGDAGALARVIPEVVGLSRIAARDHAVRKWAHGRMVEDYVRLYHRCAR